MLIGVDWGTTRLRAYLIGADGWPVARKDSDDGLLNVKDGDFAGVLERTVGPWREDAPEDTPVLLSGMVGSRQGWVEAPYVGVPATAEALAAHCATVETPLGLVRIVPGVAIGQTVPRGGLARGDVMRADVMRGEETEVMGALEALGGDAGTFVLPGTHSKWVTVEGGAITDFSTYMTGEIFAAMKNHTILGKMMSRDEADREAYLGGVARGLALGPGGELMSALFGVRVEGLMGRLREASAASYLSGLLIGAEVGAASRGASSVTIVAAAALAERYARALEVAGVEARAAPPDTAARGLAKIAAALG